MCKSSSCHCYRTGRGSSLADSIPGPFVVLVAILRGLWWVLGHVVTPAAVVAFWWLSGGQVFPGRDRRYRRYVHASGRLVLVAIATLALLWPLTTGLLLLSIGASLGGVAAYQRRPIRPSSRKPIRTTAYIARPVGAIDSEPVDIEVFERIGERAA